MPASAPATIAHLAAPVGVRSLPLADEISDEDLVARARRGDTWAEEKLYRRHVQHVYGLAARMLRSRAEAEDVAQDAFAIALEQLPSLREGASFRAWLTQITVSQVQRRFRRSRLLRMLGLERGAEDASLDMLASNAAGAEVKAELAMLDRALRDLPSAQRAAWMLRHVEGESLEDVATLTGCSLATAKRWIAAADARVRVHVHLPSSPRTATDDASRTDARKGPRA
jgi:RNA polymerase sigma-70 factor (ECF subfamily)